MIKIGILDLGINNLYSIYNCLHNCGYKTKLVTKNICKADIDLLVIPGVGSFKYAMKIINERKLNYEISNFLIQKNKYIYGICLGMQIFFEKSNEFGNTRGLSIIKGEVKKFNKEKTKLVTNIGWRKVKTFKEKKFYYNIENNYFYFVHSYFCNPKNQDDILLTTNLNNKLNFCSAVRKNNIIGTQFHPEKSGIDGINFLKNIIKSL